MQTRTTILVVIISWALALGVASLYIEQSQETLVLTLERAVAEQSQTLITLAELSAQNRTDVVAAGIVRDCSTDSRRRFEELLNQLATLSAVELQEITQLFDACAGVFAERRAVMVARLERELDVYREYTTILQELEPTPTIPQTIEDWEALIVLERERATLLSELVDIQGEIIASLRTGEGDTDAFETTLVRAQQVSSRVAELNGTIAEVRTELYEI